MNWPQHKYNEGFQNEKKFRYLPRKANNDEFLLTKDTASQKRLSKYSHIQI